VLQVENTVLEGVKIITPRLFEDERGFFMETFSTRSFAAAGLPTEFFQDNHSYSKKGYYGACITSIRSGRVNWYGYWLVRYLMWR